MKTYNKKSNAKRAAESLAKKHTGYSATDPIEADTAGEWYPAVIAPRATIDAGVPEEIASAAYVNSDMVGGEAANKQETPKQEAPQSLREQIEEAKAAREASAPKQKRKREGKSKVQIVASLLTRSGGCTRKDILDATDWPSVSVDAQAKAAGLKLRKVKEGRTTTYFGS